MLARGGLRGRGCLHLHFSLAAFVLQVCTPVLWPPEDGQAIIQADRIVPIGQYLQDTSDLLATEEKATAGALHGTGYTNSSQRASVC